MSAMRPASGNERNYGHTSIRTLHGLKCHYAREINDQRGISCCQHQRVTNECDAIASKELDRTWPITCPTIHLIGYAFLGQQWWLTRCSVPQWIEKILLLYYSLWYSDYCVGLLDKMSSVCSCPNSAPFSSYVRLMPLLVVAFPIIRATLYQNTFLELPASCV